MPSELAGHLRTGRKSHMAKFFYVINKFSIAYQPMKPNSQLHAGFFCARMVNIFIRPNSQKNTHVLTTAANPAPTPRQAARPKPEIRATKTAVPPKSRCGRLTRARCSAEPSITTIFALLLLER